MAEMMKEEDDKILSKMVSKEGSITSPSFRVYYGGIPIGVPFVWEAKPGIPKDTYTFHADNNSPPPLTPPPAYSYTKKTHLPTKKARMTSTTCQGLFPKMLVGTIRRRRQVSSATLSLSGNPRDGSLFEFAINEVDQDEEDEEEKAKDIRIRNSQRSGYCFPFMP